MIKIICLGKIKEKYINLMIDDYMSRIKKYHKIDIIELKDTNNLDEEAQDISKYLNSKDYVVCLDLKGQMMDSVEFSNFVSNTFNHYSCITFIIGSSYGISEKIIKKSQRQISFSKMTFPHGLFRAILLEQIYRGFKIQNNEAYHK